MKEADLDASVDAAFQKLSNAADRLATARIRTSRIDVNELINEPIEVDDGLMYNLASLPTASPELRAYCIRVYAGECQWCDVERLSVPVPSEVAELKASPHFMWRWESPAPAPEARRTPSGSVGPTDWPDDHDEYPTPRSWLV
ncbi:MAG: hypothetical protein GX610_14325 [Rhodococcus sp.]|nr:hypothetical protein [Rhodococcus sp. (in: high G+C Gram-positive bacteria)]